MDLRARILELEAEITRRRAAIPSSVAPLPRLLFLPLLVAPLLGFACGPTKKAVPVDPAITELDVTVAATRSCEERRRSVEPRALQCALMVGLEGR